MPYHSGVLADSPTGPDMIVMPGGRAGREDLGSAPFPPPAGNLIDGDPVGGAGEVDRVDAEAVEELFKGVYPRLAGWVRRLVDDDETAHEIASEAFVRLLSRWTRVDSPQSYLYMIATNLIRDHWRKTERERRALRSVTAGAPADPVEVRHHRAVRRPVDRVDLDPGERGEVRVPHRPSGLGRLVKAALPAVPACF